MLEFISGQGKSCREKNSGENFHGQFKNRKIKVSLKENKKLPTMVK